MVERPQLPQNMSLTLKRHRFTFTCTNKGYFGNPILNRRFKSSKHCYHSLVACIESRHNVVESVRQQGGAVGPERRN